MIREKASKTSPSKAVRGGPGCGQTYGGEQAPGDGRVQDTWWASQSVTIRDRKQGLNLKVTVEDR